MSSALPPVRVATTGLPSVMYSAVVRPNASMVDGVTQTSAASTNGAGAACSPANTTRSATPSARARSVRRWSSPGCFHPPTKQTLAAMPCSCN